MADELATVSDNPLRDACSMLERKFCEAFVKLCGDKEKAAIDAGCGKLSAMYQAKILFARPHVKAFINQIANSKEHRERLNRDWVIDRLASEGSDMSIKGTTQAGRVAALKAFAQIKGYLEADNKTTVVMPVKVFIGINYDEV